MNDAVDAGDDVLDLLKLGEIGRHEIGAGRKIVGRADIAPADVGIDAGEHLTQTRADAARGSGDKNFTHGGLFFYRRGAPGIRNSYRSFIMAGARAAHDLAGFGVSARAGTRSAI